MVQTLQLSTRHNLTLSGVAFLLSVILITVHSATFASDEIDLQNTNNPSSEKVVDVDTLADVKIAQPVALNYVSGQVPTHNNRDYSLGDPGGLGALSNSVNEVFAQLSNSSNLFQNFFINLTANNGLVGLFWLIVKFLFMCIGGGIIEKIFCWKFGKFRETLLRQESHEVTTALFYSSFGSIIDLFGIALFAITGFLISLVFSGLTPLMETFLSQYYIALIVFRVIQTLSNTVFAPKGNTPRLIKLNDSDASRFHSWILLFSCIYVFGSYTSVIWLRGGLPSELVSILRIFFIGLTLTIILIFFIWANRDQITSLFSRELSEKGEKNDEEKDLDTLNLTDQSISPRQILSRTWPYFVTIWLLLLWLVWALNLLQNNDTLYDRVNLAWWLTLIFPIVDRIIHRFLAKIVSIKWLQSRTFKARSIRFTCVIQTTIRLLMCLTAIVAFTEACGVGVFAILTNDISRKIISAGTEILLTLLVAYTVWVIIQSVVEAKIPEPDSGSVSTSEGEGGAGGVSRTETLLPLLRTLLLLVIVITSSLSILHALGVQIAPLLAGAGVVGIAIGFGSQKLVQDIISGFFFLWDDAFRRGEYIEASGLKGTVEYISIRSMRLRHHLGAVQTLPYSEISTVRNLSRDWATMKLEIRLPYDTDIDQVRKIIKKVGRTMLEHEEYGSKMLLPLKSQGVSRIEESTLIVRMKFTCQPGEQWVIRREAYRLVKEALEANNIHFAHREVKVAMPYTPEEQSSDHQSSSESVDRNIEKSAAAALSSIAEADKIMKS